MNSKDLLVLKLNFLLGDFLLPPLGSVGYNIIEEKNFERPCLFKTGVMQEIKLKVKIKHIGLKCSFDFFWIFFFL